MANCGSSFDQYHESHYSCHHHHQRRGFGFLTPPPTWKTERRSPLMPASEKRARRSPQPQDLFHVIHKVPSGDSPYVKAKHVQLIDKDPSRAVSLFWAAINSGDRVDSALKDMAVVMKQLDRSDEAIEAIKSFRHLCPPESQESLDNILIELYKQSGRIQEEIEILQLKVKQLEKGIAFGGKRTKIARSQGKKIQITVEKEYSRLLGNIAWAYMQQEDFKSAEEHYRKALSFEPDKNKQCNLALCLMHMNKLTEAKFLLQAIRLSSDNNWQMDESYAKSFERASRMLVELELGRALKPVKLTEHEDRSPVPLSLTEMNKGVYTDIPYEKRTEFDWRRNYYQLNNTCQEESDSSKKRIFRSPIVNGGIPKVPFTQPKRFSSLAVDNGDQRKSFRWGENAANGGGSCRKLLFEPSSTVGETFENSMATNVEKANSEIMQTIKRNEEGRKNSACGLSTTSEDKKSWADMVEEEEQSLRNDPPLHEDYQTPGKFFVGSANREDGFNDENVDCNIMSENPTLLNHQTEELSKKIESIDLEGGYFTQPDKSSSLIMSQSVRRSLCFDGNHEKSSYTGRSSCTSSPFPMKTLNFGGGQELQDVSEDFGYSVKSMKRRNRLQVFNDITHVV